MSQPELRYAPVPRGYGEIVHATQVDTLADVLERVLDRGVVIAGDVTVRLMDIELLTIHLRLLVASVDKAREMGINWWEYNPFLSQKAAQREEKSRLAGKEKEVRTLKKRIAELERALPPPRPATERKTRKRKGARAAARLSAKPVEE